MRRRRRCDRLRSLGRRSLRVRARRRELDTRLPRRNLPWRSSRRRGFPEEQTWRPCVARRAPPESRGMSRRRLRRPWRRWPGSFAVRHLETRRGARPGDRGGGTRLDRRMERGVRPAVECREDLPLAGPGAHPPARRMRAERIRPPCRGGGARAASRSRRTLRRLAVAGPDDFYRGRIASQIDGRHEGEPGGFVRADDLARVPLQSVFELDSILPL